MVLPPGLQKSRRTRKPGGQGFGSFCVSLFLCRFCTVSEDHDSVGSSLAKLFCFLFPLISRTFLHAVLQVWYILDFCLALPHVLVGFCVSQPTSLHVSVALCLGVCVSWLGAILPYCYPYALVSIPTQNSCGLLARPPACPCIQCSMLFVLSISIFCRHRHPRDPGHVSEMKTHMETCQP